MRYRLFPSLTFLSYLKKLHVYYSPARIEKADVARRLIIFASSQKIKQRYPLLTVTWELLAYDNPPMIEVEYLNGEKEKINIEYFSDRQKKEIIDKWKYTASLEAFPEVLAPTIEKPQNSF
ncbi:conserved protein, unknown function [Plasmodium yoelii]|uniref:Uncharacterized protein n=3 Tax=Plasmodium yoelii TaxID=5861 RepID=Q7RDP1_PLAYO|nr:conserved protein, unknown function [Plasmodium yoelii]EAA17397.1 hypothetical protein [Plasmodium yoelii yoelii]WBY55925.1 hypothetical protein Py17XNL_000600826 [Plasmodium yoelii yoelii]CDU16914.1 conserved Plasmodium protein, unknown function [Plasmodium yoelii]VTZ75202.1 conserved protein, unknown function [Plasmodium yoelii]|eukprot:XP_725832.1 conserved protein, unknown function [Plasmodium yoelii]